MKCKCFFIIISGILTKRKNLFGMRTYLLHTLFIAVKIKAFVFLIALFSNREAERTDTGRNTRTHGFDASKRRLWSSAFEKCQSRFFYSFSIKSATLSAACPSSNEPFCSKNASTFRR